MPDASLPEPHRIPTRAEVERLMKRCQIGVGGRNALHDAHDIMAECYGMLGLLIDCLEHANSCLRESPRTPGAARSCE